MSAPRSITLASHAVPIDAASFGSPPMTHNPTYPRRTSNYFSDAQSSENVDFSSRMAAVRGILNERGVIHPSRVKPETNWFFNSLGLDDYYFKTVTDQDIASHILSIYSAKVLAHTAGDQFNLRIQTEHENDALYLVPSFPGVLNAPSQQVEYRVEQNYFGEGYTKKRDVSFVPNPQGYRMQVYRTDGPVAPSSNMHLRFYFLQAPNYPANYSTDPKETDLVKISDTVFFEQASELTKTLFTSVLKEASTQLGPVSRVTVNEDTSELRLVVAYRNGTTHSFFSGISALYHYHGFYSTRKYVERFSNGYTIYSIYLKLISEESVDVKATLSERAVAIEKDIGMVYVLPRSSLTSLFLEGKLSKLEVCYAYCAWKFIHQFLNNFDREYAEVLSALRRDNQSGTLLSKLKIRLRDDALNEEHVREVIFAYPEAVKDMYAEFAKRHHGGKKDFDAAQSETILAKYKRVVENEFSYQVISAMSVFNKHILKTNFFKQSKTALSFRLDPSFLSAQEFPTRPFAVFFICGSEFRGFHVRFDDVARGGIRIIRSATPQQFSVNVSNVFQENYNLAHTQQKKNKDIPEGGSKGTILLSLDHQDKNVSAFEKYIDAILDLLLPEGDIIDYYGRPEILFLGPDEGTADFMDWASQHARNRNASFWKAFTTGKSTSRGGIPHDLYGMTTRSVHQYVLGILEKEGIEESACTKFQTGGPDGDLGSNEIKISKDVTIGIVDGSGVLCDPNGLNREELLRLATKRQMVKHFDTSKLSEKGFLVLIEETNRTLPDGTVVENGLMFRNSFHLTRFAKADIFVPCGGRPEAINNENVALLCDPESRKCNFKYIVEGANLFISVNARERLEKAGVVLFKDSSANKGGVTSSSLEVLSALALSDEEFQQHMMVKDGIIPDFYRDYVEEVQHKIEENARMEFECIWNENKRTGLMRSQLSDKISEKVNRLNDAIKQSVLWDDEKLRERILVEATPKRLISLIGYETFSRRVPEPYLRAIFGAYLASRYVYKMGLDAAEFAFFTFIRSYVEEASA
eukprot:TRINITY_DN437_c0_g1_i1.p1 TRINITY_DN437_c0_g1~~TRINITY_DN437_c0_g1_i1.p1  ORF type:complete len:1033 (+),score=245.25 TRINITY_DN437_c0_g1_i1:56-3154(+)